MHFCLLLDHSGSIHALCILWDCAYYGTGHRIKQKEFKEGDKVLLFNSRVKLFGEGKLRSKWKGPYTVINMSSHGAITIQDDEGNIFKVNGQWLKVFREPSYKFDKEIDVINLVDFN